MSKIYLKTHCYVPHEIEWIKANLEECYPFIDKMIVCEYDVTCTGVKRDFQFSNMKDLIPARLHDKLDYHACSISNQTVEAYNDESKIRNINDPLMRSWFTKLYDFAPNDIIISIDCDEIIYGDKISYIVEQVQKHGSVCLKQHQFFYKKNYLWKNKNWESAIATYYSKINPKFPGNWRHGGHHITEEYVGCHFSWCMDVDAMIHKLHTYPHTVTYRFCAKRDILEDAIKNKKYPFDPGVNFNIEEISSDDERLPKSMRTTLGE